MNTIDNEKTIIGSILYHDGLIRQIQQNLTSPNDFMHSENRAIYQAMIELDEQGLSVNLLTVYNELEKNKKNSVDRAYIEDIVANYAVEIVDAISISKQLSEFASQRILENKIEVVATSIRTREKNIQEYVGEIESLVTEITKRSASSSVVFGKELTNSFMSFLGSKASEGLLTGLAVIDKTVFNFFAGELIIVAARPGVGKTTLLIQSSIENLHIGKKVGFITMEMDPAQLFLRMVAYRSGIDSTIIRNLDPIRLQEDWSYRNRWSTVIEAISYYESMPLYIETAAPYTLSSVLGTIRKLKYVHDIDIIYVDYMQLIEADRPTGNRNAELTTISRKLKNLGGELKIPVVCAAQLSREVEKRVGQRPILSDLRDSGSLEQDASMVLFLYPNTANYADLQSEALTAKLKTMPVIEVILEIAKARSGPINIFPISFDKRVSKLNIKENESGFPLPAPEEEAKPERMPRIDDPWS